MLTQSNRRPHNRHPRRNNKERPQPGLKENPAKTKQIFDKSHPYFPKSCKGCKFNKGLKNKLTGWFTNADGDCYNCALQVSPKYSPEEKHAIYTKTINEQFKLVKGNIKRHLLKSIDSEDYEQILNAAVIFSKKAKEILILPEIHKSETEIRERLKLEAINKTPDLRLEFKTGAYEFIDVKSPLSIHNVVRNANEACRQGGAACITDENIETANHAEIARKILSDTNYTKPDVYVKYQQKIYKYNSQGLVEVPG